MFDKPFSIRHKQFEYGPLALGVYRALIAVTLLIPLYYPEYLGWHLLLLLFLGLGLRPLLELTGIYKWLIHMQVVTASKLNKDFDEEHAKKMDRKMRDDRYRNRRQKHPDLPKNW